MAILAWRWRHGGGNSGRRMTDKHASPHEIWQRRRRYPPLLNAHRRVIALGGASGAARRKRSIAMISDKTSSHMASEKSSCLKHRRMAAYEGW